MEIRHFVFGKFFTIFPEFGARIVDSRYEQQKEIYKGIEKFIINKFDSVLYGYRPYHFSQYPEVITLYGDSYLFIRFFPPFTEQRGTNISPLYHCFIFNEAEMQAIDYSPWKYSGRMISEYSDSKIIGPDGSVWITRDEAAKMDMNRNYKEVRIEIPVFAKTAVAVNHAHESFSSSFAVVTDNVGDMLNTMGPAKLLSLFSSGLLINGDPELAELFHDGTVRFIFLHSRYAASVNGGLVKLTGDALRLLEPDQKEKEVIEEILVIPETKPRFENDTEKIVSASVREINIRVLNEAKKDGVFIYLKNEDDFQVTASIDKRESAQHDYKEWKTDLILNPGTGMEITDNTVLNGHIYNYRVKVQSTGITSMPFRSETIFQLAAFPCPVKKIRYEQRGANSIYLSWDHPHNQSDVKLVLKKINQAHGQSKTSEVEISKLKTSYEDTLLEKGSKIKYQLYVMDTGSNRLSDPAETEVIEMPYDEVQYEPPQTPKANKTRRLKTKWIITTVAFVLLVPAVIFIVIDSIPTAGQITTEKVDTTKKEQAIKVNKIQIDSLKKGEGIDSQYVVKPITNNNTGAGRTDENSGKTEAQNTSSEDRLIAYNAIQAMIKDKRILNDINLNIINDEPVLDNEIRGDSSTRFSKIKLNVQQEKQVHENYEALRKLVRSKPRKAFKRLTTQ